MGYINNWDEFYALAEQLFNKRPEQTRYTMKYRHVDGEFVLKVTDDVQCLKYKTDRDADLKRMEKLNNLFFGLATSKV